MLVLGDVRDGVEGGEHEAVGDGAFIELGHRAAGDEVMHELAGQRGLPHSLLRVFHGEFAQIGGPFVDVDIGQLAAQFALLGDPAHEDPAVAQPEAAGHDGEGGVAVFAGMHGEDEVVGGGCALGAGAGRIVAGVRREAGGVHQGPDDGGLLRDIEMLPESRPLALAQGDCGVGGGLHAGVDRGLREADRQRRAVALALQPDQPAGGFDGQIGGGALRPGAVGPVRGDGDVDQRGVAILDVLVTQLLRRHFAGIACFDQYVGGRQQRVQVGAALIVVEVEHDAALAEAHHSPVERAVGFGLGEGREAAAGDAAGRFDLDHFRAHVGKHAPGHFCARAGQIEDADALQQCVAFVGGHLHAPPGSRRRELRSGSVGEDSEARRKSVGLSWRGTSESSRRTRRRPAGRAGSTRAGGANPRAAPHSCGRGRSSARAAAAGGNGGTGHSPPAGRAAAISARHRAGDPACGAV